LQEQLKKNSDMGNLLNSDPKAAQLLKAYPTLGALLRENDTEVDQQNSNTILADVSTCSSVGVTTPATWNTYTSRLTHALQQCSLSTQNAAQFDTSLKARQYPMPVMYSTWNEVLIKVWPAGIPERLPLAAFYYENPTGLAQAKAYQQKYVTRTRGHWLPIIKLDTAQLGANPFSYRAADQAVQP
jgi:methionyl-tRNA formyltransferase